MAAQMTYEAYGTGGTGFVIECLTDNVNRSATEVSWLMCTTTALRQGSGSAEKCVGLRLSVESTPSC